MTWRHVALIALAVALAVSCAFSHTCSSAPDMRVGIIALAGTIVGGVFGDARSMANKGSKEKEGP